MANLDSFLPVGYTSCLFEDLKLLSLTAVTDSLEKDTEPPGAVLGRHLHIACSSSKRIIHVIFLFFSLLRDKAVTW